MSVIMQVNNKCEKELALEKAGLGVGLFKTTDIKVLSIYDKGKKFVMRVKDDKWKGLREDWEPVGIEIELDKMFVMKLMYNIELLMMFEDKYKTCCWMYTITNAKTDKDVAIREKHDGLELKIYIDRGTANVEAKTIFLSKSSVRELYKGLLMVKKTL